MYRALRMESNLAPLILRSVTKSEVSSVSYFVPLHLKELYRLSKT